LVDISLNKNVQEIVTSSISEHYFVDIISA